MDLFELYRHLTSAEESSDVANNLNIKEKLNDFNSLNERTFDFSNYGASFFDDLVAALSKVIGHVSTLKHVITSDYQLVIEASLRCLKILSRSRDCVTAISKMPSFTLHLFSLACAREENADSTNIQAVYASNDTDEELEYRIKLESLKIVCNCIFHSSVVRQVYIEQNSSKYITNNLSSLNIENSRVEGVILVQLKIMFLISALNPQERKDMSLKYQTPDSLVRKLEEILINKGLCFEMESLSSKEKFDEENCKFSQNEILIVSEALKTLFNLSVDICEDSNVEVADCHIWDKLSKILYCLLTRCTPLPEKPEILLEHVAHMVVNIPRNCLHNLTPAVRRRQWQESIPSRDGYPVDFELRDMSAIITLITELDKTLQHENDCSQYSSKVFSILASLCHVCRYLGKVRKYLRYQILPHLKDATVRPEELPNLRGRLVKLMTNVDTNVKSMAADFLFVLCKENPDRLVKYTGYGNAAGLLASRGLMGGNNRRVTGDYSSDDEDSETEEFKTVADDIDVMTGAISMDRGRKNLMNDMTDDEKEKSAEELMSLIGRLTSLDVIKPMKIGEDGRPIEMKIDETNLLVREKMEKP